MPLWKILGQDSSTSTGSTGRSVAYTNGTTDGGIAWALIHNRTAGSITPSFFVSTSTASSTDNKVYGLPVPANDTFETSRFTMSTGDSVLWFQTTTGLSVSVFGAEGIAT